MDGEELFTKRDLRQTTDTTGALRLNLTSGRDVTITESGDDPDLPAAGDAVQGTSVLQIDGGDITVAAGDTDGFDTDGVAQMTGYSKSPRPVKERRKNSLLRRGE